ncbi:hypothetical protein D9611_002834 [Ephemerocybe angulata]|uniref:Uncharacterized protein n=1 Tax=Ephemerocybe angulata TaxID=980116 RepID=A0A8H5C1T1_9AGAR|nr:hypothetical protein D9611_002834 [Tulosesus angulatus]
MSSPIAYVPIHKRSPSGSSITSMTSAITTPVLSYTRDELLALAPSASTSHTTDAEPEHTYIHHQPHQGWATLNTTMRRYLRLSCPEIVMNRKMRKAVEYQHFQHRTSGCAQSPSAHSDHSSTSSRTRSQSPSARSLSSESPASPRRERRKSDSREAKPPVVAVPEPAVRAPSTTPTIVKKRAPVRRIRPSGTRARYNSFTAFHRQLAGAGADTEWRRGVTLAPQTVAAC